MQSISSLVIDHITCHAMKKALDTVSYHDLCSFSKAHTGTHINLQVH